MDYIVSLAEATRSQPDVLMGVSPRGSIALMQAAKGCALMSGRRFVLPDDVQRMAFPVLCHRIIMRNRAAGLARQTPEAVLNTALRSVSVPAVQ